MVCGVVLVGCGTRGPYVPLDSREAAVDPACWRQCKQIEQTCDAGCRKDLGCYIASGCSGIYLDCLHSCPIARPEIIAPYLPPPPTPVPGSPYCGPGPFHDDAEGLRLQLDAAMQLCKITREDFYRCQGLPVPPPKGGKVDCDTLPRMPDTRRAQLGIMVRREETDWEEYCRCLDAPVPPNPKCEGLPAPRGERDRELTARRVAGKINGDDLRYCRDHDR